MNKPVRTPMLTPGEAPGERGSGTTYEGVSVTERNYQRIAERIGVDSIKVFDYENFLIIPYQDFFTESITLDGPWVRSVTGDGVSTGVGASSTLTSGIWDISLPSGGGTGAAAYYLRGNTLRSDKSPVLYSRGMKSRIDPAVSACTHVLGFAVDTFFTAAAATLDPDDGAYFLFDNDAAATERLLARTSNGGTDTTTTLTNASYAHGSFFKWRIELTATRCLFYIDDVLVAVHTTNLPTSGDPLTCGARVAGDNISAYHDYMFGWQTR